MAWSKPEWNTPMGAKLTPASTTRKRLNARFFGALAGLIVVVGALTAWFLLSPAPAPAPSPEPKKTVKPKKAPKVVPSTPEKAKSAPATPVETTPERATEIPQIAQLTTNAQQKASGAVTNAANMVQVKGKASIFHFPCENEIARMLTMEPGTTLVGAPTYNGRFTKQFLESLECWYYIARSPEKE